MDLKELLAERKRVEAYLASALRKLGKEAALETRLLTPFLRSAEEFTLRGGKRFRACMLLAGYTLAGGRPLQNALPAAAALETFQSWMLIHDDVIDHGETRRNGPTLHLALARYHTEKNLAGSDADFGQGMAITLGDLYEPFTVGLLLEAKSSPPRKLAALGEYSRMAQATALGQVLDVLNTVRPVSEVSEADVLRVHRLKSAIYTVASPLRMGALLAGARPELVRALGEIGVAYGTAFQLRDDVLGVGAHAQEVVGKSTNDLLEGKRTLLVVYAHQKAGRDEREALERVLGNPLATPEQFEAALSVLEDTGSFEHSERAIAQWVARGDKLAGSARGLKPEGRALLREIGQALSRREQ
jgi:geranylgeranyl diphosphate synthase type I